MGVLRFGVNGSCGPKAPRPSSIIASSSATLAAVDDDENEEIDEIEEECDLPPLTQAAVALHEVFLALVDGGFEDYDAIRLVAQLIIEQGIGDQGISE